MDTSRGTHGWLVCRRYACHSKIFAVVVYSVQRVPVIVWAFLLPVCPFYSIGTYSNSILFCRRRHSFMGRAVLSQFLFGALSLSKANYIWRPAKRPCKNLTFRMPMALTSWYLSPWGGVNHWEAWHIATYPLYQTLYVSSSGLIAFKIDLLGPRRVILVFLQIFKQSGWGHGIHAFRVSNCNFDRSLAGGIYYRRYQLFNAILTLQICLKSSPSGEIMNITWIKRSKNEEREPVSKDVLGDIYVAILVSKADWDLVQLLTGKENILGHGPIDSYFGLILGVCSFVE